MRSAFGACGNKRMYFPLLVLLLSSTTHDAVLQSSKVDKTY